MLLGWRELSPNCVASCLITGRRKAVHRRGCGTARGRRGPWRRSSVLERETALLIRRQWHLGSGRHANAADSRELNWNRHVLRARISEHREMQMRPRGKARVSGVGYVLTAGHPRADTHADRVPMQVGIDGNGAIIVENLDDIGLIQHDRTRTREKGVVTDIDYRTFPRGVHGRPVWQCDVDRVLTFSGRVRHSSGVGLRNRISRADRKRYAIRAGWVVNRGWRAKRCLPGKSQHSFVRPCG